MLTKLGGAMRRTLPGTLFAIASLGAASSYFGQPEGYVRVQAHRGFSELYPENTLLAIAKALDAGADQVEVDLALTADGHVVLMHDRTVGRTTDGEGPVSSLTLEQLREFDAGSWKGAAFAGEPIPTLREALELAAGRGVLNLEIKARDRTFAEVLDTVAAAVELVHELGAGDRVVFSSFDLRALQAVREIDPELRLTIIDWDPPSSFDGLDIAIGQKLFGWSVGVEQATPERIAEAKAAGLFVHVSGTDSETLLAWIRAGADEVGADDPETMVRFLEEHGFRHE
jgi:glycerophosphoryl diester phosphodiesterase